MICHLICVSAINHYLSTWWFCSLDFFRGKTGKACLFFLLTFFIPLIFLLIYTIYFKRRSFLILCPFNSRCFCESLIHEIPSFNLTGFAFSLSLPTPFLHFSICLLLIFLCFQYCHHTFTYTRLCVFILSCMFVHCTVLFKLGEKRTDVTVNWSDRPWN